MKRSLGTASPLVAIAIAIALVGAVACSKKEEGASGAAAATASAAAQSPAPAPGGGNAPKVGDSCKGISATDGKLGCEGNKVIFCSSYSNYEWKMQRECPSGQTCSMSADGKAASCK